MLETVRARIGFVGPRGPNVSSMPHLKSFQALIPEDIEMTFEALELPGDSMYDYQGKLEALVSLTVALADKYKWDGVILSAAPREVLNPGLFARLSAALKIPVTTALRSSIAALKALSATRTLLMTPFDEPLNKLIRDFLSEAGIEALSPSQTLRHYMDAEKLLPGDVESMAKKALKEHDAVEAIYFQGAVLDPLEVLEKMEAELNMPIVASNPAMLWFMLSRLGIRHQIPGYGRLLSSWPELPMN